MVVVLLVLARDQSALSCQEVTGFKFVSLRKYPWRVLLSLREELIHQIIALRMQLECLTLYWGSKQLKGAFFYLFACALYVFVEKDAFYILMDQDYLHIFILLVYIIDVQLFTACDHDRCLLYNHLLCRGCLLVRQAFFHNDMNSVDVGGGVIGIRGFHSSFRPTHGGLSLNIGNLSSHLNVSWTFSLSLIVSLILKTVFVLQWFADVSTTMILKPGPVIEFLKANQNVELPRQIDWIKVVLVSKCNNREHAWLLLIWTLISHWTMAG